MVWQSPRRLLCSWRKKTEAEIPLGTPLPARSSLGAHPCPPVKANTTSQGTKERSRMEEVGGEENEKGGGETRGWREQGPAQEGQDSCSYCSCSAHGLSAASHASQHCCFCSGAARGYLPASPPQQCDRGTASRSLLCPICSGGWRKACCQSPEGPAEPRQSRAEQPSFAGCLMFSR